MDDDSGTIPPGLIDRARAGDPAACRDLVGHLHPWVSRRVRSQIRRHADVDDVVQEVFLRVFVKLDQFRGEQPFHHWLGRLAVNTCYDWLRRQKARPSITASDLSDADRALLNNTLAGDGGGDGEVRADLLNGLLDRLLASLKPREQIVIRLLDLEQRPVAEVADLTGWSASKVKVTAFRARKKLTETLRRLESR
jgi:RNA polymerase sigma-70 factor (ECF subfamily)